MDVRCMVSSGSRKIVVFVCVCVFSPVELIGGVWGGGAEGGTAPPDQSQSILLSIIVF